MPNVRVEKTDDKGAVTETIDINVERKPQTQIVTMSESVKIDDAILALQRQKKDEDRWVTFQRPFDYWPLDGAQALDRALKEMFGWVDRGPGVPTIHMAVGPDNKGIDVPWGSFEIPGIDGTIGTSAAPTDKGSWQFVLAGKVRQRDKLKIDALCDLVERTLREHSVYKGKAVQVLFPDDERRGMTEPEFLTIERLTPDDVVLPGDVSALVEAALYAPILFGDDAKKAGVPVKRGVLLEGPFGTGKTLVANVTANLCAKVGWTYLYLRNVAALDKALQFARTYAPCVIFAEDADEALAGERDHDMNRLVNALDGVDTKGLDVMVVLTTNHIENLNPVFLRHGRIDTIVSFRFPDAPSVEKLMRRYGRGLVHPEENIEGAVAVLADKVPPASVREAVERSKLVAITRQHKEGGAGAIQIAAEDLRIAALQVLAHYERANAKRPEQGDALRLFGEGVAREVFKGADRFAPTLPNGAIRPQAPAGH